MPTRHGGMLAKRASTWPRDHFCRSTMAPRSSWPTTWNEFFADIDTDHRDCALELLGHGVLLVLAAPSQHSMLVGREHGRTIPLADMCSVRRRSPSRDSSLLIAAEKC